MTKCVKCEKSNAKAGTDFCQKCGKENTITVTNNDHKEDNNDLTTAINKPMLVQNELLSYAFHYVHNCAAASMINVISEFYSSEDILEAMKCLGSAYAGTGLLNEELCRSKRVSTASSLSNVSLVKLVEDLVIKGVVPLAEQTSPHVKFCAVDLAKVPRFAPEEVNMNSLLMRVQKLETSFGKLEKLESTCNSNANDIKRVWTSLQSSGHSVR